MTDIVTAAGPNTHARVAVARSSTLHSLVWADGELVKLEDRTSVSLVGSTRVGHYVGVVHGFPTDALKPFTVAAAIVAGFACVAVAPNTAKDWAVGCRVYAAPGTQQLEDTHRDGLVLVGYVVPGPPRAPVAKNDHLDIIIAR